jgi:hypothetical protein
MRQRRVEGEFAPVPVSRVEASAGRKQHFERVPYLKYNSTIIVELITALRLLAGPSPSRQNQLRTKKQYCVVQAGSEHRQQETDNGPMPNIADLAERATGVRVSKTLPCGDDYIILLDHYQASQSKIWANLRRMKSTGEVVWATSPPNSSDIFTNVDCRDGRLVAWTWQGFMITVDQETGKPVEALFTK